MTPSFSKTQTHCLLPKNVRPPSLTNQTPAQWDQHTQIAYLFARHARHDLINIHCAMGMLEAIEQTQETGNGDPLPQEMGIATIKAKLNIDVKQLISVSNDLIFLSQAASPAAYKPTHIASLATLIEDAIHLRLPENRPVPSANLIEQIGSSRVLAYGDQLTAALTAFYFQWTPWSTNHTNAARVSASLGKNQITFNFAADDIEPVARFARRLHSQETDPLASLADQILSSTTTELALWMARFVVLIHGGTVDANPNDPDLTLRIMLPLAG